MELALILDDSEERNLSPGSHDDTILWHVSCLYGKNFLIKWVMIVLSVFFPDVVVLLRVERLAVLPIDHSQNYQMNEFNMELIKGNLFYGDYPFQKRKSMLLLLVFHLHHPVQYSVQFVSFSQHKKVEQKR